MSIDQHTTSPGWIGNQDWARNSRSALVNAAHKLLRRTLARTGLTDASGEPLHYTAHDFRRMFAAEAVIGGLPVHIVARLLGHASINTPQAYTAIFDEDLVRRYRTFLDSRRPLRLLTHSHEHR